jgi:hypothetical protein
MVCVYSQVFLICVLTTSSSDLLFLYLLTCVELGRGRTVEHRAITDHGGMRYGFFVSTLSLHKKVFTTNERVRVVLRVVYAVL